MSAPRVTRSTWFALNSNFGENGKDEESRLRVGNVELPALVAARVPTLPDGSVVFLAEGLLYDRSEFTEAMWNQAIGNRDVTFIVGANDLADDGLGNVATVQVFGISEKSRRIAAALKGVRAAVTFPATMWHPWRRYEHYSMNWPNRPVVLDGHQVHISWCYESTILWPHLHSAQSGLQMVFSPENRWSSNRTSLEEAQSVSGQLISRWLGAGLLLAVNR